MSGSRSWSWVALAAGLAFAPTAVAAAAGTSSRTAMILLRALVYDKQLTARVGSDVTVLVADSGSGTCAADMVAAFKNLPSSTVKGLPLVVDKFAMTDAASLEAAIAAHGADAVFLCEGTDVAAAAPVLVRHHVIGMGGTRAAVVGGLALGAVVDDTGAAKVIVNLPASRDAGVEFATDLFALAEVIR